MALMDSFLEVVGVELFFSIDFIVCGARKPP